MAYFSSDYIFDGVAHEPYPESHPPHPLSQYGKSKLEGERLVAEILPENHLIIRTSWLFGRHGKNFVDTMIRLASDNLTISVVDDQIGSPTYTKDLAVSVARLIQGGARGIYHVVNTGETSWHGFARYFLDKLFPAVEVNPIPTSGYPLPAQRPAFSVLSSDKLMQDFQFQLPSWQDAVDRYIAAKYKDNFRQGDC